MGYREITLKLHTDYNEEELRKGIGKRTAGALVLKIFIWLEKEAVVQEVLYQAEQTA